MRDEDQLVEVYEISTGTQWYEGVNKIPTDTAKSIPALVSEELQQHDLKITAARPGYGRGLIAGHPVREKEVVCHASCLFFDSRTHLDKFLGLPGNEFFRDRVVQVPNVKKGGIPHVLWGALVGLSEMGGLGLSMKQ